MRGDQVSKLLILICWIGVNVNGGNGGFISSKASVAAVATDKSSTAVDYNAPNYDVNIISLKGLGGFNIQIRGRGINNDQFHFNYDEDITVCNNKKTGTLVIGNKIYAYEPNSMILIENNHCMERKYIDGKLRKVTKIKPTDCVEIKKKMADARDEFYFDNDDSFQYDKDDDKNKEEDTEEEEIEEEKIEKEEDTYGDYIDRTATDVNTPRYYVQNWGDSFGNRRVDIYGKGIMEFFIIDTYTMHSDKVLVVGRRYYSDQPDSLIEVSGGTCVERRYKNGVLRTKTPVARKECTRVKKALDDAYTYIKSGAWKTDGKGNRVQHFQ